MADNEVIKEIKQTVQEKFAELKSAVMMREKLLLRQLEVINSTRKQQLRMGKGAEPDIDTNINFLCDNEQELLAAIRNFGRYQLTNLNLALQDVYLKNEDYIKPSDDHETMFKGLNQSAEGCNPEEENEEFKESIVVDFSRNKNLMEHNAKLMNDSIINITLKEAKELIKQAKLKREQPVPPLNLEELDDEVESSIADVVSSLEHSSLDRCDQQSNNKYSQTQQQSTKQKRFKPKITINNCNGTINLRNIASLTINCTTDDNVQAQIPVRYPNQLDEEEDQEPETSSVSKLQTKSTQKSKTLVESVVSSSSNTECTTPSSTTTTPNSLSNYSSNNSSRSQSTKKQKSKKSFAKSNMENKPLSKPMAPGHSLEPSSTSTATNEVTCDFYNRLLNEIKKSINQQQKVRTKFTTTNSNTTSTTSQQNPDSSTSCNDFVGGEPTNSRRLVLKNFENLKIILEANNSGDEDSFHPVQIEQWLAEIISETDLEPMQNTDILEHSKIHSEETQET